MDLSYRHASTIPLNSNLFTNKLDYPPFCHVTLYSKRAQIETTHGRTILCLTNQRSCRKPTTLAPGLQAPSQTCSSPFDVCPGLSFLFLAIPHMFQKQPKQRKGRNNERSH